jgi:phosphonate transport system substrate-binding protein
MKVHSKYILISFISVLLLVACSKKHGTEPRTIHLESNKKQLVNSQKLTDDGTLHVAIATMISPQRTFNLYIDLVEYISKKINIPVTFVQRKSYQEVNELLVNGYLDLAFICSGAYVEAVKSGKMEIIAVPVVNGKPYYYSYLIVPASMEFKSMKDLMDKRFAFVDPLSNTGRFYPLYLIKLEGLNPATFFKEFIYSHSHDRSIEMVAQGIVDGAAVDSMVWEYYVKTHPEVKERVKVVMRSEPFGIPPFVSTSATDRRIRNEIRDVMLNMNSDERGRNILSSLGIDRFERADDSLYDSIRRMNDLRVTLK